MVNSAVPTRRRLSVEARRDELIEVCVRLIGTRDWDTVTMADIAAEAEISKGLLYHYFSAKPDLYLAAVRRAAAQLSAATMPDPRLPTRARLEAALLAHVEWIDTHALAYRTIVQGGHSGDPEIQAIIETSRAEVLERIVRDARLTTVPPALRIALRGWVGFLEGACLEWLDTKDITKQELMRLIATQLPPTLRAAR